MKVIIAEKPSVGRHIAKVLGDGKGRVQNGYIDIVFKSEAYAVTWAYGHLFMLKQAYDYNPDYSKWINMPMPFFPDEYGIKSMEKKENGKWVKNDGVLKQFSVIKKLLQNADLVINATDYDREGEVIFSDLYNYCNCKLPYKKVKINSNVDKDILNAFDNLEDSIKVTGMANAGKARRIADFIIGSNLSVYATLKFGGGELLTAGRIQTPTLNLIVEREKAIQNFVSEPFYGVGGIFTTAKGEVLQAKLVGDRLKSKLEAEKIIAEITGIDGIVKEIKNETQKRGIPLLYNTSMLQKTANEIYGYTLDQTAEICQCLYETGYITYPRSSSRYLTQEAKPEVKNIISRLLKTNRYTPFESTSVVLKEYIFDNSQVEAHGAIIPTTKIPTTLEENQQRIYDLIADSLVRTILDIAELVKTSIIIVAGDKEFETEGLKITKKGWLALAQMPKERVLPTVSESEVLDGKYGVLEGKTTPPNRYTDASLLTALKSAGKLCSTEELQKILNSTKDQGIGTEDTRKDIVPRLIQLNYVYRNKKNIVPTQKGIDLITQLPFEELKSPELTAIWEQKLSDVQNNLLDWKDYIKGIETNVLNWVLEANKKSYSTVTNTTNTKNVVAELNCPICAKPLIQGKKNVFCSGYTKDGLGCNFSIFTTIAGKKLTKTNLKDLIVTGETRVISGFQKKADATKTYSAKLKLNNAKTKVEMVFSNS